MNTSVLPSKDQYFRSLLQAPAVAWPTVGLFVLAVSILGVSSTLALMDRLPLWAATLVNGFAIYLLFSVAHDGSHRAISKYPLINETLGRIAIMLLLPIAPLEGVRWLHMQHHQHTNSIKDPDRFVHHVPWWAIPFTWPNVDMFYLHFFITKGGKHFRKQIKPVIAYGVAFIGVISVLAALGYGVEVFCLWFIASRIAMLLIALVFIHLPHSPGNILASENVYRASTIRRGFEWLLSPLLVCQNYHLIHHLYPTAPFFRYFAIWNLKYDEIIAHDPAIQDTFSMKPLPPRAPAGAAAFA